MGAAGGLLLVVGLAMVGMAALMRKLRGLSPDQRASLERQAEARRAGAEIQRILVPCVADDSRRDGIVSGRSYAR